MGAKSEGIQRSILRSTSCKPSPLSSWLGRRSEDSSSYWDVIQTCQNTLRTVIRHMHTLRVDPHTIRPPSSTIPPPAFASPGPDKPYASTSLLSDTSEAIDPPEIDDSLSLYAARLELKALQDMQKALQRLMDGEEDEQEEEENTHSPTPEPKESLPKEVEMKQRSESPIPIPEITSAPPKDATTETNEVDLPKNDASASNPATGGLGGLADYADSDASDVDMEEAQT